MKWYGLHKNSSYIKNFNNKKATGRRYVKPGYEIYQIGGPSNNSFAHTISLSSVAQSTFQLKISIISTEVKNIVNILKQVMDKISVFILIFICAHAAAARCSCS